ncbi:Lon protease family protein [Pseudogemmobacter sp. W21_MBD1_M6]|uniref:Lon protease family protein n=1 Tax=Pseudogemmobacter sp. W21_MBD1_M6 TaxID=3240271 RepID=UPI003F9C0AC9
MTQAPHVTPKALDPQVLRRETDQTALRFKTTADLKDITGLIGQDRAVDAIRLAASIPHRDFNVFVVGPAGTGRHRAVDRLLRTEAEKRAVPCDWAYVNNFDAPHKPHALRLPPGTADRLKSAMEELVDDLTIEISAAFESEDYQTKRRAIEQEFGQRHEDSFADFYEAAKKQNVAVLHTPMGFTLVALLNGEIIKPEAYEALGDTERDAIDAKVEALQQQLAEILQSIPGEEKEHRARVEKLHADMAEQIVSTQINQVKKQFADVDPIQTYIAAVRQDMAMNAELFLQARHGGDNNTFPGAIVKYHSLPLFRRYAVNVMVSHNGPRKSGAPLEKEILPTLGNLTGRVEHESEMGTLQTDFTLIKPGALHRANGGYLVLDARRVLTEPLAWEALKRCLDNKVIAIASMSEFLGLGMTKSLEPDPIPLDVRIILIGDRMLYLLLGLYDPDFGRLFKLQADFEDDVPRTSRNLQLFARVIATAARHDDVRPLTAPGVARLLDQAVRLADDSTRFSLNLGALTDIMREADFYAGAAKRSEITRDDIEHAVTQAERRASRIRDRSHEMIKRDTILIDTSGAAVGQINGLSVLDIGTFRFGQPTRISARVRVGAGKVVDIEREVELGGPLHSKGVLILSGYLAAKYALEAPMSLHASIVFEQSYGGVDGDSASSAELYALLSALSGVPIQQRFAVTGSVNQAGQVQAIGGVNEKIEGFFDICKARRLTGHQGVLIPASNVEHLMLRADVVEAARKGSFQIIPIKTIDQGIEVLTGLAAGQRDKTGQFPEGSVNARVEAKMRSFAEMRKRFGRIAPEGEAQ